MKLATWLSQIHGVLSALSAQHPPKVHVGPRCPSKQPCLGSSYDCKAVLDNDLEFALLKLTLSFHQSSRITSLLIAHLDDENSLSLPLDNPLKAQSGLLGTQIFPVSLPFALKIKPMVFQMVYLMLCDQDTSLISLNPKLQLY